MTQDDAGSAPMLGSHRPAAWVVKHGGLFMFVSQVEGVAETQCREGMVVVPLYEHAPLPPDCPVGLGFEDYADEHAAIEDQLKSLGLSLPDSDCVPTTDELSAIMVEEIKRLRLTDEERSAIEVCANHWQTAPASKILLGLLERLA